MRSSNVNAVFYAESYHPIQAGSIDGTDIVPHDNAIYRALLCSSAGLYDPLADPKTIGDPYCTVFVGRLSHLTTEDTLRKAMSKYGQVKSLRLVRDIVTGASRGYAFVEYETEREMRCAYEEAHHTIIDDREIIVDYNRQQLMPGWIPRRLGGGLGGRKESGQLRFGGRERPFRAPLRPIPLDDLKKLGIPPPPEGRYMSRHQVPSPPRRKRSSAGREGGSHSWKSKNREEHIHGSGSVKREEQYDEGSFMDTEQQSDKLRYNEGKHHHRRRSTDRSTDTHNRTCAEEEDNPQRQSSIEKEERRKQRSSSVREERTHRSSPDEKDDSSDKRSSRNRHEHSDKRSSRNRHEHSDRRSSRHKDERSHKRRRDDSGSRIQEEEVH